MRAAFGFAVGGGLFFMAWLTFPFGLESTTEIQRVKHWFLVTAFLAVGAAVVSLVVAVGWKLVNGA